MKVLQTKIASGTNASPEVHVGENGNVRYIMTTTEGINNLELFVQIYDHTGIPKPLVVSGLDASFKMSSGKIYVLNTNADFYGAGRLRLTTANNQTKDLDIFMYCVNTLDALRIF